MRVLMLGWDFSPRLSGGVGSACQGLANALARAPEPIGTEILFALPRLRGDEEPERVRLLAGDRAHEAAPSNAPSATRSPPHTTSPQTTQPQSTQPAPSAPRTLRAPNAQPVQPLSLATSHAATGAGAGSHAALARDPARSDAPFPPAPSLATPLEALRLLAIDSPLRPYLTPADYAAVVSRLLARIRGPAPRPTAPPPTPVPPMVPDAGPAMPRAQNSPARRTSIAGPARVAPEPVAAPGAVPPYGVTLQAEVERYARAVLALVQDESFDVIHAHDWMTFPAGLLLQERSGKPLVVHFHSCEAERRGAAAARDVRAIEQAAIDAAERVLCVSEASARTLREHYALEYAKLRVLHNAYSPLTAGRSTSEHAEPVVLFLGRLSEQKGPDVFLRAAASVSARHPDARFVLAGEGELYPELAALVEELGLLGKVEFTGFVSGGELARTYADADVYVLSSSAEPFGISALEALSLGVPTIVPRGAGVTEVVRSVLRFESGDVDGLADKIVALLERPALRSHLSTSGLREVKKLRWDRPARALRGIYDEIARVR